MMSSYLNISEEELENRARKGAFFTPQYAVKLSQKCLADTLGENWQDEYYIWDCAAGTGNLLAGLTNKYNIWASTLDRQDVDAIKDRIRNGANLLDDHVFQFDFLNDDFSKCPPELQKILNDEKKRKKLVIYINPPYAEAATATTVTGTGENKSGVATDNKTNKKYKPVISKAANQLFALFFIRIYKEIPSCILAEFSTLKILQAKNFTEFRKAFRAKLNRLILMPADSFDNVKGHFPIGFFVWDTNKQADFAGITADVYDNTGKYLQKKNIYFSNKDKYIGDWLTMFRDKEGMPIGMMQSGRNDFQNQNRINIQHIISDKSHALTLTHTLTNLMQGTVYFSVRLCIRATWLNDCDQFLYPSDSWKSDKEFHSDCLAFALFHSQNRISSRQGVNHWIPFREGEVNAKEKFESNFMTDYIAGKISPTTATPGDMDLFSSGLEAREHAPLPGEPITFSAEASAVFDAGRELWRYYHSQPGINVNASFYDIREHFQGRTGGRMNNKSTDEKYTKLITNLRENLKVLAGKIEPKVYEHGFLK